jgi:hypothetical protein
MPQIDHRIGNGFECVVQLTETFKAQQQAPELVFPGPAEKLNSRIGKVRDVF